GHHQGRPDHNPVKKWPKTIAAREHPSPRRWRRFRQRHAPWPQSAYVPAVATKPGQPPTPTRSEIADIGQVLCLPTATAPARHRANARFAPSDQIETLRRQPPQKQHQWTTAPDPAGTRYTSAGKARLQARPPPATPP